MICSIGTDSYSYVGPYSVKLAPNAPIKCIPEKFLLCGNKVIVFKGRIEFKFDCMIFYFEGESFCLEYDQFIEIRALNRVWTRKNNSKRKRSGKK